VSVVPSAVEPAPLAERPSLRGRTGVSWLIAFGYLAGALLLTARLWADPASRMTSGNNEDIDQYAWFLRYSASAVAHGHLPALVTTALNAPRGVNMMWNTAFLLPGMLLTPVTLLAGPQVSLTVVLTLGIAGSAASLFWVLRRWGASRTGAALGGAVYGFSPALVNSGIGHYNFAFAVLPPLIIHAGLQMVTGRGNAVRNGALLGLLAAMQVFIGEEVLVDTAVAGLVLVAAVALGQPRAVARRIRDVVAGTAAAAVVALLIAGYPMWVQFRGPLHEHAVLTGSSSGNLALFVEPPPSMLLHSSSSAAYVISHSLSHNLAEALAYLGWPLIVTLLAAGIWYWWDAKVRAAAITWVVLELCSLGGGALHIDGFRLSGSFLPYHWLQGLPAMAEVIPQRFCIVSAGAAGAVLAFALDRARSDALPQRPWRRTLAVAVAILAVVPLIPVPYHVTPVRPVPDGWRAAITRLRLAPGARVMVVPVPSVALTEIMRWQADTGDPGTMIGGYFLGPSATGQPVFDVSPAQDAADYLNRLWSGHARHDRTALVRWALRYWRPAAVVALTRKTSRLSQFLISLLGQPSFRVRRILVWRL
jgi:hypothetical protein